MASSIQKSFISHVSKTLLWTTLPLSFASLFGTLIIAAFLSPVGYDWRVRPISHLTSPRENPEGFWLPATGIMVAIALGLPSVGYIVHRLRAITPGLGRSVGLAFSCSFGLMLLAVLAQLAEPVVGVRWLHEFLARCSAVGFIVGMFCCCGCALKERLRRLDRRGALPDALTSYWLSLMLLPMCFLIGLGALMLLGHWADLKWAEDFRQSFRHTMLWHLAFWEWIGIVLAFAFLAGSVLLVPASGQKIRKKSVWASTLVSS